MTWPIHPIADLFEVARGGSPRPIQDFLTDEADGLNWIMIGDATDGSKYITETQKRIKPEGLKRSRMVHEGDFLLTNSMSFGRPYILKTSGCIHDGWLVLSPRKDNISSDFFYYLLGSDTLYREFSKRAAGAVVKNLNTDLVKSVQIPLPPLGEQKRIAGVLDAADTLRAKRRESLEQLDNLLKSTFLDMFGDPVTNPMGWEVNALADLVFVQGGFAFKSKDYCKQGVRLVKISNVHSGNLTWDEIDCVPDPYLERYKDFSLKPGDLVIALTRPIIKSLGSVKIATVGEMDAPSLLNQRVARFVFSLDSAVDKSYLLAFCRTQVFKNAVQRFCSESLQPNMSTKQLGSLLIAQPPIELQRRFAAIVESVEQQKASQRAHLDALDTLFASLQSRAFRGDL